VQPIATARPLPKGKTGKLPTVARRLLLILPAVAVGIVLWAVLAGGGARPVLGIQVLGGPSRAGASLSVLLRAVQSDGTRATPVPALDVRVRVRNAGEERFWTGVTDATGHAEMWLDLKAPSSDPSLRVTAASTGDVLGEGMLVLDAASWQSGVRRQGGWLPGRAQGALLLRVVLGEGALAVPFAGDVWVQVLGEPGSTSPSSSGSASARGATAIAGARLDVELEGAELVVPTLSAPPISDARGLVRLTLRPLEHAVALRLRATAPLGTGSWYGALPVVPGALHASLEGGRVSIRSPIERDVAYVSVVTESERLAGAILPLTATGDGAATGLFELPPLIRARIERQPSWAVVSSEDDKRSPAVVGWPLAVEDAALLGPTTFDAPDRVLIDGVKQALANDEALRSSRRSSAAQLLLGVGAALVVLLLREIRGQPQRAGRSSQTPPGDQAPHDALELAPRAGVLALALGCVALGIAALAYFATRLR
jgi:hypothetical protein